MLTSAGSYIGAINSLYIFGDHGNLHSIVSEMVSEKGSSRKNEAEKDNIRHMKRIGMIRPILFVRAPKTSIKID